MRLWPRKLQPAGVTILLLQKRLERFSTELLNAAMQRGWRREYNSTTFFALSIFDGDGAVLKLGNAYFTLQHFDRRLEANELGDLELPHWATHTAYSSIEYKCPGGVPSGELRENFYSLLGLLCAELLSDNSPGIFFLDERVIVPNDSRLLQRLRSGLPLNPHSLIAPAQL